MPNELDILKDYIALPDSEKAKINIKDFEVLNDYSQLPNSEKEKIHADLGLKKKAKSVSYGAGLPEAVQPLQESGEDKQSIAGNVIPFFDPKKHGLTDQEKFLLKDRESTLKARDQEIKNKKQSDYFKSITGLSAKTVRINEDVNVIEDKTGIVPSLRPERLLPSEDIQQPDKELGYGLDKIVEARKKEKEILATGGKIKEKMPTYDEYVEAKEEAKEKKAIQDEQAVIEGRQQIEFSKLSIADKAKSYGSSLARGGFGGFKGMTNITGDIYTKTIEVVTGKKDWGSRADNYRIRKSLDNLENEYLPEKEALKGNVGSSVARAFGNIATSVATTVLTGGSAVMPSVLAFSETYDSEKQQALKSGANEETANVVGLLNGLATAGLSSLPILNAVKRADKITGVTIKEIAKKVGTAGAIGVIEEGGGEIAEQGLSNVIAKKTYDPNREISEGIVESGAIGGGMGLVMNLILSSLGAKKLRSKSPKEINDIQSEIEHVSKLKEEYLSSPEGIKAIKKDEIINKLEKDQKTGKPIITPEAKKQIEEIDGLTPTAELPLLEQKETEKAKILESLNIDNEGNKIITPEAQKELDRLDIKYADTKQEAPSVPSAEPSDTGTTTPSGTTGNEPSIVPTQKVVLPKAGDTIVVSGDVPFVAEHKEGAWHNKADNTPLSQDQADQAQASYNQKHSKTAIATTAVNELVNSGVSPIEILKITANVDGIVQEIATLNPVVLQTSQPPVTTDVEVPSQPPAIKQVINDIVAKWDQAQGLTGGEKRQAMSDFRQARDSDPKIEKIFTNINKIHKALEVVRPAKCP